MVELLLLSEKTIITGRLVVCGAGLQACLDAA